MMFILRRAQWGMLAIFALAFSPQVFAKVTVTDTAATTTLPALAGRAV